MHLTKVQDSLGNSVYTLPGLSDALDTMPGIPDALNTMPRLSDALSSITLSRAVAGNIEYINLRH